MPARPSILLLLCLCFGCASPVPRAEAWDQARALERALKRQTPGAGPDHRGYVAISEQLLRVPRSDPQYDEARAWLRRIEEGRLRAAWQTWPEELGEPPADLPRATPPPRPALTRRIPRTRDPQRQEAAPAPVVTPGQDGESTVQTDATTPPITLYSTTWCGYCRQAKSWLEAQGLPYTEVDIERDAQGHQEYLRAGRGYRGVPLITVGDRVLRGFDARALAAAIEAG